MQTSSFPFFKHFPKIQYNGKLSVDLLTFVQVTREKFQSALRMEPFVVSDDDTMDGLAHWIYNDPYMFYILALLNDIQDPFNDWVCNMIELNRIVIDKYRDIFLLRHKERVLKQLDQFFFDQQRFYFTKKLITGRYYIKLYFKDPSVYGTVSLTITEDEKIKEDLKEKTDIYSSALIQSGQSESQSFLDLTSDQSYITKIFLEEGYNNLKIDLSMVDFIPFTFEKLIPYKETAVSPFTKEIFIERGKSVVIEYNNEHNLAEILFYGTGGDLTIELYNASYLLINRTSTYKFVNINEFINSFGSFLAKPEKTYENIELYAYSNTLLHKIIADIYENQKATNFLNFSFSTLREFLVTRFNEEFSPIMYDILSDYYNEKQNSAIITSNDTGGDSFSKVRCASTKGIDLSKKDTKTIDGVILEEGDLVLLKDQNNQRENGIYRYNTNFSLMRVKAFNYYPLMTIYSEQGTKNVATEWMLTNRDNVVDGTDLVFVQVYGVIFEGDAVLKNLKKLQGLVDLEVFNYYAQDIYNDTHHWETTTDSMLGEGIEVSEDYSEPVSGDKSRVRLTNFEYETNLNDSKRNIFVLHPKSIGMFTTEFERILGNN